MVGLFVQFLLSCCVLSEVPGEIKKIPIHQGGKIVRNFHNFCLSITGILSICVGNFRCPRAISTHGTLEL